MDEIISLLQEFATLLKLKDRKGINKWKITKGLYEKGEENTDANIVECLLNSLKDYDDAIDYKLYLNYKYSERHNCNVITFISSKLKNKFINDYI